MAQNGPTSTSSRGGGAGTRHAKNVWATCKFSNDIISADFSKAKFAVELHEFLDGTADKMYQEPEAFFDNTFLTDQMRLLVRDTLARLSTGSGQPVTVIDTGFGGGKTHSLLLLHHILRSRDAGLDFVQRCGIASDMGINTIPDARIVEIDCRRITKNTLWGEIAHRLGRYAEFEETDTRREPPTDITAIKRLFDGPILVMLDELPHYLFKADSIQVGKKTLGELTILFIMELISAVASSSRACLILTLTEKQNLYEAHAADILSKVNRRISDFRVDELVGNLNEAISRQAHTMTPVNRNQIYDVVNARLVQHVDKEERAAVIREYADYYEKYGMDTGDILEKMERSYPFHPGLIDMLHDRVSTIGKFNQTRGMLRLLARVVRQVVEERPSCQMIGTSDIKLGNAEIKDELTVRLGLDLGTVMDVDCVNHAKEADSAKSVRVVEPTAATIMLFSLHGHTKKTGIRRGDIKISVGYPGLDPSLIDKALDEDIMQNFWYIHDTGGQEFYFDEFPNINAIIHEHKKSVTTTDIRKEIRHALTKLLPSGDFRAILWESDGLTDDNTMKLFVAGYDINLSGEDGDRYLTDMLNRSGDNIRTNKNTIVVVCAEPQYVPVLKRTARTLVAIRKAKKDEKVKAGKRFMRQITGRETDAQGQLRSDCLVTYSGVLYPHGTRIRHREIRFGESKKTILTEAVADLLEKQGKLVRNIGPDGLEVGDKPVKIRQIYDSFAQDRSKPFVLDKGSVGEAVREGMRTGQFGYCTEIEMADGKYVVESDTSDFDWNGFLVNSEMARTREPPVREEPQDGDTTKPESETREFRYVMRFGNFDGFHGFVRRMPILNLDDRWKSSKKEFQASLSIGDVQLTVRSVIADHKMLKDLLGFVSGRNPDGKATITVVSGSTLESFFVENDLEAHRQ